MNKSESIKELASALAKAQAELPAATFDAENPFLKNKYASLGAIIETSRPVLAKHGLAVSQLTITEGDQVGVTTVLMHASGEWLESTATLATGEERGKSSAQVAGSVITYLRRYSLASVLGMYADEDTDGHAPKTTAPDKPAAKSNGGQVSDEAYGVDRKMTLEFAENETTTATKSKPSKRYGDIDTKTLSYMANELAEKLNTELLSDKDREEKARKLEACKTILAARKGG